MDIFSRELNLLVKSLGERFGLEIYIWELLMYNLKLLDWMRFLREGI